MPLPDWKLARRELLKGLGLGAACLPLLNAGRALGAPPPRKLVCVVLTGGYRRDTWLPAIGPLGSQQLPRSSVALEPHKSDLIVLPELTDPSVPGNTSGLGAYGTIFYGLPDVRGGGAYKEPNGQTVDQVVAASLGPTGRPTLSLAVQIDLPPRSSTAPGASRCFWRGPGLPVVPEGDPLKAYRDLFSAKPMADPLTPDLLLERKSILDYVGTSLTQFKNRLGSEDRAVIDAHLQSVRELETQLSAIVPGVCGTQPDPFSLNDPEMYPVILNAQVGVMLAALSCGVNQVVTLQLSDAAGQNVMTDFVPGVPPGSGSGSRVPPLTWYEMGRNPGSSDYKPLVDKWFTERLAALLAKMKAVPETKGSTMLDNSVVLWATTMQDMSTLDNQKIPWVLAGRCGGYFKTGQCVATAGRPISGVLGEVCRAMGVVDPPFGAPMPDLRA